METDPLVQAIKDYMRPHEGLFGYESMLYAHLDVARFGPWVQEAGQYRSLIGATVLSSGCGSAGDLPAPN
jgi:hypothetical protein